MRTLLAVALLANAASAEPLRVLSWNVESGGNDPAIISGQLAELGRADLYCLQEVAPSSIGRYGAAVRDAHGKTYRFIASNTGRGDRLIVIYDTDRLELLEVRELFRHGQYLLNDWRHRSPLVLELKDRKTGSEFAVMTVHMARGDKKRRREQAAGLREWARARSKPVIGIGDFNYDYSYPRERGNQSFDVFVEGGVWKWARPTEDIDSNWSDRDGDGQDNYPDSCLDFAFTSGEGLPPASARVIVREGDFPDDNRTSDHRPLELVIE